MKTFYVVLFIIISYILYKEPFQLLNDHKFSEEVSVRRHSLFSFIQNKMANNIITPNAANISLSLSDNHCVCTKNVP
jgi:hypothetical protein